MGKNVLHYGIKLEDLNICFFLKIPPFLLFRFKMEWGRNIEKSIESGRGRKGARSEKRANE